jgi:hypothetical protein
MTDEDCATHTYGDWSAWNACSEPCGGGTQSRMRECLDGAAVVDCALCGGNCQESRACNERVCDGPPTTCGAMMQWRQCSVRSYVPGIHGDNSSATACAQSCGAKSAGCASYIVYPTSTVCVCHDTPGLQEPTFPFERTNTMGNTIYGANCI